MVNLIRPAFRFAFSAALGHNALCRPRSNYQYVGESMTGRPAENNGEQ